MKQLAAVVALALGVLQAPRGTATIESNGVRMSVEYGRPSLDGRDMLAQAPVGFVWRLGADRATTLTVDGTALFGNMVVGAGEYSLFAERTSADRWTLIVNTQSGQWGTEHDRRKDLLGVPLKWEKAETSVEELTIELAPEGAGMGNGILSIRWGKDVLRQRFRLVPVATR